MRERPKIFYSKYSRAHTRTILLLHGTHPHHAAASETEKNALTSNKQTKSTERKRNNTKTNANALYETYQHSDSHTPVHNAQHNKLYK